MEKFYMNNLYRCKYERKSLLKIRFIFQDQKSEPFYIENFGVFPETFRIFSILFINFQIGNI